VQIEVDGMPFEQLHEVYFDPIFVAATKSQMEVVCPALSTKSSPTNKISKISKKPINIQ